MMEFDTLMNVIDALTSENMDDARAKLTPFFEDDKTSVGLDNFMQVLEKVHMDDARVN